MNLVLRVADTIDSGKDHDAETGGDQAIFDSGRARFIIQETHKRLRHIEPALRAKTVDHWQPPGDVLELKK